MGTTYCVTNLSIKIKTHKLMKVVLCILLLNYVLLDLHIALQIVTFVYASIWLSIVIAYNVRDLVMKSSFIVIVLGIFSAFFNPMINVLEYENM